MSSLRMILALEFWIGAQELFIGFRIPITHPEFPLLWDKGLCVFFKKKQQTTKSKLMRPRMKNLNSPILTTETKIELEIYSIWLK